MAHYRDLSKYRYFEALPAQKTLNIGWLKKRRFLSILGFRSFRQGSLDQELIQIYKDRSVKVNQTRGFYECEFCKSPNTLDNFVEVFIRAKGSCEVHIKLGDIVYAAPELIFHYIEEHNYLPPKTFVNELEKLRNEFS